MRKKIKQSSWYGTIHKKRIKRRKWERLNWWERTIAIACEVLAIIIVEEAKHG